MATSGIHRQLMKHLVEENGPDQSKWNQELRDLVDPTIEARTIAPPISGKVEEFINTDYHYYWAADLCGPTAAHDRVHEMKYAGWEFATTDDVKMCSESSVVGRSGDKTSKDGRKGFSDEIRSGDRRLMKLPMHLWRVNKKAQLMAAYQMAYPQPFGATGAPMSANNLLPGFKSKMMNPEAIDETRRNATPANSVTVSSKKD